MTAPVGVQWVGPESFSVNVRGHRVPVSGASYPGIHGATSSELLVGAVASSMLYCVEVHLGAKGINPQGLSANCEFEVSQEAPLRIETIAINLMLPEVTADIAEQCEQAARGSVVHAALAGGPEVLVSVNNRGGTAEESEQSVGAARVLNGVMTD